jgi:hypothetical protein
MADVLNGFGERPSALTFRDLTEKNRHLDIQVTVSVAPHRSLNAKIDRLGPNSFLRRVRRSSNLMDRFHPDFTV